MAASIRYLENLGRAAVGAVLFALPLFMTMEMWELGSAMDPLRLAALLVLTFPLLVALAYLAGFERAFGFRDHLLDAFAAVAVAAVTAALALLLVGALAAGQPLRELVGKIAVLSFPGALGALVADKQLKGNDRRPDAEGRSYLGRLALMTAGALFIALNVAPTEEVALIAFKLDPRQTILLALISLAVIHALLFWVDFPGRDRRRGDAGLLSVLIRRSCAGYAACALSSLLLLWSFGRLDGLAPPEAVQLIVVLAFPASFGAGLAGLVVGDRRA